jgi:hypothetical protein
MVLDESICDDRHICDLLDARHLLNSVEQKVRMFFNVTSTGLLSYCSALWLHAL